MFKKSRTQERKPLSKFGFIQILGDDGGQILNISESGLCFATLAPIGHVKNVKFWCSLNLRDRVDAMGEIAWLDAETRAGGLRFLNLTERAVKHIRAYATGTSGKESCEKGRFFAAALSKRDSERAALNSEGRIPDVSAGSTSRTESLPAFQLLEQASNKNVTIPASVESTDLISLQRHLTVCRRQLYLGVVIGAMLGSAVAIPIAGHFGNANRVDGSHASVATAAQENANSRTEAVQAAPATVNNPSSLNVSAPMNAQRTIATRSYAGSSESGAPKSISAVTSSPFSLANHNSGAVSPASQSRAGDAVVAKKSSATPQQLWSAVQAGDTNAAVLLADRYLRGDGVPPNCIQARVLLLAASEKKNPTAIKKLHELDQNGCS